MRIKKYENASSPIERLPYTRNYQWRIMPQTERKYKDYYLDSDVLSGDKVWTDEQGNIVTTDTPNAAADFAVQYRNPRFELDYPEITIEGNGKGYFTGESFADRYARELAAPIAKNADVDKTFKEQAQWQHKQSKEKHEADVKVADARANLLTPGAGTFVVAPLALTAAGIGGATLAPFLAPGTLGGNIIGTTAFGEALNQAIKYGTGKTLGEHAVNAARYLGIPLSQWGDFGILMIGDLPFYVTGDLVGKQVANTGRTLTKEALDQLALDNTFKGISINPTTKDLAKAINESIDKQSLHTPSILHKFDNPYQITKVSGDKIRLRLPSHTQEKPREVVLVPHGNNLYELHIRTWDGDHVPANLNPQEKTALFESVYNELPEGAEILFPESSADYPATRGTVAALTHLSRDSRFQRGNTTGTLTYTDKDGNLQTFTGNSFIKRLTKPAQILELLYPEQRIYFGYFGPKHSINEVVNPDGTVNVQKAMQIANRAAYEHGGIRLLDRLENPEWHKTDPNTFLHTKEVAQRAWQMPIPAGYTKLDLIFAALGHDFGKMFAGEGHGEIGADYLRLMFPDMTDAQYNAIARHMMSEDVARMQFSDQPLTLATMEADRGGIPLFRDLWNNHLTDAERLGIPKGERTNIISTRDYPAGTANEYVKPGEIAVMDEKSAPLQVFQTRSGIQEVPTGRILPSEINPNLQRMEVEQIPFFSERDPYAARRLESNTERLKLSNPQIDYLGSSLPKEMLQYLEQIKDVKPDPRFLNSTDFEIPVIKQGLFSTEPSTISSSEIPSYYVTLYRNKLASLGYNTENVSDYQLAQLLTDLYNQLTNTMTGKVKGLVFWHGGNEWRDIFDLSHTGQNTGNMGAMGPGNYFSSGASSYGKNMEPVLITDIESTPIASETAIRKGLIPEYVTPASDAENISNYLLGNSTQLNVSALSYVDNLKQLIQSTPTNENMLWIDPAIIEHPGVAPLLSLHNIKPMEFMLRRNTGIKSLFPHPQAFINRDGKILIDRNWADPRINFKRGGRLIPRKYKQYGN